MLRKNKLFISVFVLILSILTLGTVTYAWFVTNTKADIIPFEVQATAGGDSMEIAVSIGDINSNTYWGPAITSEMMGKLIKDKYTNNSSSKDLKLNALTSKDGINFYNFKNGAFNPNILNDNDGEYLSFRIYFRSIEQANISWTKASLLSSSVVLNTNLINWTDVDGTLITEPSATTHYTHHAARISIVNVTTGVFAYEHYSNTGIDSRNIILGDGTNLQTNGDWGAHSFFRTTTGTTLDLTTVEVVETQNINDTKPVIAVLTNKVGNYYIDYVTVNVWLEGWDQNTFDGLLKSTLSISLEFERS